MQYSWIVGFKKFLYVFIGTAGAAIAAMQQTGNIDGVESLTWPVIIAGVIAAVKWVSNFFKVKKNKSLNNSKFGHLLPAILIAFCLTGCITSNTRDATYELSPEGKSVKTAETEHNIKVFSVKNLDKGFTEFGATWDGQGGVSLSTAGNVEGLQTTTLDVLIDKISQILAKAIEGYVDTLLARPPTLLEVIDGSIPHILPIEPINPP